jgi:hypothetical protein
MRLICGGSIIWKAILFEALGCNLAGYDSKSETFSGSYVWQTVEKPYPNLLPQGEELLSRADASASLLSLSPSLGRDARASGSEDGFSTVC